MKLPAGRPSSRQRILDAAEMLAREQGPGNISLDAVAARAGLSKGGLLYNFPSKAKLLEALVEMHIARAEIVLAESEKNRGDGPNAMALAYLDYYRKEVVAHPEPASGVLAAIAENPEFIDPVRRHQQRVIASLRARSTDFEMSLIAFLAVEGLWSLRLLESDCLDAADVDHALDRLAAELSRNQDAAVSS